MSDNETGEFSVPSNPVDRKKIRDAIHEISGAMRFIDDKREYIKDVISTVYENYKIPKKVVAKMAKTFHNDEYSDVLSESATFEIAYETIMGEPPASQTAKASDTDED